MKDKRGFTLVELLVVMVILGIVIGLSFPAIRVLQEKNADKKYNSYKDSLKSSAKLYVDSYDEDLFGRKESGCACIKYEELESKKLTKDITVKDVTCDTDNTFVRVNKVEGSYTYDSYIGCKEKNKSKVSIIYPKQDKPHTMAAAGCDTMCNDEVTNGIYVYAEPSSSTEYSKKHYSTVRIKSITGINQGAEIYYAWSKNSDNSESLSNYKRVRITVPANQKEIMEDEWNRDHSVTATSTKIYTPAGKSGSYYLHVRVDRLYDLYDSAWKQGDGGKYLVFGPFNIDNEPPRLSYSFESSNSNYNSVAPKLNLDVDDNITSQNKLKICVSVKKSGYYYSIFYNGSTTKYIKGTTSRCGPDYASNYNFINNVYKNFYTPVALTTMENYGTSYPTAFSVIDEALNQTYVETSYKTSERYKLTYDSNGGKDCSPTYKYVMKKNSGKTTWGELCETTLENYVFDGWYTAKSGGTKVTKDTEVTKSITVYAHWKPQKYTVKLVKGTGISEVTLNGKTNLTQSLDYGSTYTINVTGVNDYYHFTKWTDGDNNSISTDNPKSLTVTGDITLTANASKNGLSLSYNANGGTLVPRENLVCPNAINCGSVCKEQNLGSCTGNATGEVLVTAYSAYDGTGYSKSGIRDHSSASGSLPMERFGYTATKYWHVGSATSTKVIDETTPYATVKDLAVALGKGEEIKKENVKVYLYAGWDKKDITVSVKNPTNGNWTKSNFSVELGTNYKDSEVYSWYYSYKNLSASYTANGGTNANSEWIKYSNSNKQNFTTSPFSAERNQYAYFMVCMKNKECAKGSTLIKIDKTPPTFSVDIKCALNAYNEGLINFDYLAYQNKYEYCHSKTVAFIKSMDSASGVYLRSLSAGDYDYTMVNFPDLTFNNGLPVVADLPGFGTNAPVVRLNRIVDIAGNEARTNIGTNLYSSHLGLNCSTLYTVLPACAPYV